MKLVSGGCSFTYGTELQDTNNIWSKQLADKNGLDFIQTATPGSGNLQIAHHVIEQVDSDSVVVVMWTFATRYDFLFSFDTGEKNSPWFTLFPHHGDLKNSEQHGFDKRHTKLSHNFGIEKWAKDHYKFIGDANEAHHTLWQVLQLQNYLKLNNIPYMFTSVENWFYNNHELNNQTVTKNLVNNIDWDNWFWFLKYKGKHGFHHWSIEQKFPRATQHPLDEAHFAAVELMENKFNEMV